MQAVVGRAGLNPNRRITQVRGTSVTLNVGTAIQNRAAIANTSVVTGTVTDSGQPTPIATTSTLYTDPTTATFVAESDSTSTLIYSVSAFPVSVKAGDAGQLGTATSTGGSTLSAALSYRVASDSQKSLLVTLISVESKTGSNVQTLSTYRVDTTGVIAPVSVEEISSLGIVFRDVIFTFN